MWEFGEGYSIGWRYDGTLLIGENDEDRHMLCDEIRDGDVGLICVDPPTFYQLMNDEILDLKDRVEELEGELERERRRC